MKKYMLIAIAIVGIVSCCASVNAENVVDLGTMNYDDGYEFTLYVNINSTQAVNLHFITSEMNESDLGVINNGFYPTENKTLYRFVAKKITPEFWFTPGIKEYYFVDDTTKQVYRLSVNYSSANIPENPYKLLYDDMEGYYNETSQELNNISIQLTNITGRYNQTMTELNTKLIELANLHESFNTSQGEWQRRHGEIQNLTSDMAQLQSEYNQTYDLFISVSRNTSTYRTNYQDEVYKTESLQGDVGTLQWCIILAIISTAFFVFIYFKIKYKVLTKADPMDIESDTGYTSDAEKVDSYFLKASKGLKELAKGLSPKKAVADTPIPDDTTATTDNDGGEINKLRDRLDNMENTHTKDIQEIHSMIESLDYLPEA